MIFIQKEYDIIINTDNGDYAGSIFGYASDEIHYLKNYLAKHDYDDIDLNEFKGSTYGIICNMFVKEDFRNNGIGYELMDDISYKFREIHNVDYIFLICDGLEHNDFDLQKWYESWGFEVIKNRNNCPLMIA